MLKKIYFVLMPFLVMVQDSGFVQSRDGGFAVVELFTSEGCSSCPPADRLLSRIIDQTKPYQHIYCLSFHVDYWNYIGWKDPYSDKSYSERQRKYSQAFSSARIYTPQMVVNGTTEFVGSDESKARNAIDSALRQSHNESFAIKSVDVADDQMTVNFEFKGSGRDYLLNIALVEKGLAQQVTRGENSGKKLIHDNVVRDLKTTQIGSTQSGRIKMTLASTTKLERCSVIAFVQSPENMNVVAATGKPL